MSVLDPSYANVYTAAGTTGPYPITFSCILDIGGNASDIVVQVVDSNGVSTDITATSTVTGLNVYTAVAYDATYTIVLVRYPDVTQPYTFPFGTKFPSKTFENALDRLAYLIQKGSGDADQALKAPLSEVNSTIGRIPSIGDRANRLLGFDAAGDPIAADGSSSVVSTAMAPVVSAGTIDAAKTLLGFSTYIKSLLGIADSDAAKAGIEYGVETFTPISGYTPAAGDVVELVESGGTFGIRKALRGIDAVLVPGSTVTNARVAALGSYTFVCCYSVGLVIYAMVGTVDPNTLAISWGSAATVFTCTTTIASFDVAEIDGTKVLCIYHTTGGAANQSYAAVLSVSGSAVTVNSAVSGPAAACNLSLRAIPGAATHFMAYQTAATTAAGLVITVTGTTPAFGTPATGTITSYALGNYGMGLTVNSTGTVAFMAYGCGASFGRICFWSISGTTVAWIAENNTTFIATVNAKMGIECGSVLGFTLLHTFTSGILNYHRTNAGLSPDQGQPAPFVSCTQPHLKKTGDGSIAWAGLICVDTSAGASTGHLGFLRKRSSNDNPVVAAWEYGDIYRCISATLAQTTSHLCCLSSGACIAVFGSGSVSGAMIATLQRRNKILGVALDATGRVRTGGIFTTSGLTPGAEYFCDDSGVLTTTPGEVKIGIALSATKMALNVRTGI